MGLFLSGITAGQLTTVSTTALHPIGSLYYRNDLITPTAAHRGWGGQVWRYVKNGESSTSFAAGKTVVRKAGATDETCVLQPTTPVGRTYVRGVAQHTIAAASYGWVLVRGAGIYLADTGDNCTIDHVLIPGDTVAGAFKSQANTTAEITAVTQSLGFVVTAANADASGIAVFNQIAY